MQFRLKSDQHKVPERNSLGSSPSIRLSDAPAPSKGTQRPSDYLQTEPIFSTMHDSETIMINCGSITPEDSSKIALNPSSKSESEECSVRRLISVSQKGFGVTARM